MPMDRSKSYSDRQSEAARMKKAQPKVIAPKAVESEPAEKKTPPAKPLKGKKTK